MSEVPLYKKKHANHKEGVLSPPPEEELDEGDMDM